MESSRTCLRRMSTVILPGLKHTQRNQLVSNKHACHTAQRHAPLTERSPREQPTAVEIASCGMPCPVRLLAWSSSPSKSCPPHGDLLTSLCCLHQRQHRRHRQHHRQHQHERFLRWLPAAELVQRVCCHYRCHCYLHRRRLCQHRHPRRRCSLPRLAHPWHPPGSQGDPSAAPLFDGCSRSSAVTFRPSTPTTPRTASSAGSSTLATPRHARGSCKCTRSVWCVV